LPVVQRFSLAGLTASSVTPWVTSEAQALEPQAPLAVSAGTFTYVIPSLSVIIFVGRDARRNPPPKVR